MAVSGCSFDFVDKVHLSQIGHSSVYYVEKHSMIELTLFSIEQVDDAGNHFCSLWTIFCCFAAWSSNCCNAGVTLLALLRACLTTLATDELARTIYSPLPNLGHSPLPLPVCLFVHDGLRIGFTGFIDRILCGVCIGTSWLDLVLWNYFFPPPPIPNCL